MGESLVGVGIISWGIGLVGPARSSKVLALVGASIYGALAIGGPLGLALFNQIGFISAMTLGTLLPCVGLVAISRMAGVEPQPHAARPSFLTVIGGIWWYGLIVGFQSIGFAAIESFFVLHFIEQNWVNAGLGFTAVGGGFVLVRFFWSSA